MPVTNSPPHGSGRPLSWEGSIESALIVLHNLLMGLKRSAYIDSWRFYAIAMVVLAHLARNDHVKQVFGAANPLLQYGHVGVYIFFFVSGFVISKACLVELGATDGFSRAGFYTRRAFRVIPPLVLYLLACTALSVSGVLPVSIGQLLGAGFYVCNINLVDCGWYAGHTWSLAFEEQFYLLFPLLFAWAELSKRPSLAALAVIGAFVTQAFLFPVDFIGRTGFLVIYALFGAGYLFSKHEPKWTSIRWPDAMFFIGAAITFFPLYLFEVQVLNECYKLAVVAAIPMMVIATANPAFFARKLFRFAPVSYIGKISYSIYLWQQFFTGEVFRSLSAVEHLALMGVVVAGCALLFESFEQPLIDIGRNVSARFRSASLAVARTAPASFPWELERP
jgi:peptidoglycan/LPS O-acetylase OafA/YrhL